MTSSHGFALPLSLPQRLIADLHQLAARSPLVPLVRAIDLSLVATARNEASPRPGWTALFTKAWGLVCARRPPLRRSYLSWPMPRLYQHPFSVATLPIQRPYGSEEATFFLHLARPEARSLVEIAERIRRFREADLGTAAAVRRQVRLARLPGPLRRLALGLGLNVGRWRERFFGTFTVSNTGAWGVSAPMAAGLLTTSLNLGPIENSGNATVTLSFDPRVLDPSSASAALLDLEAVLQSEVLAELRYLRDVAAA